jgi:hypothetical protein
MRLMRLAERPHDLKLTVPRWVLVSGGGARYVVTGKVRCKRAGLGTLYRCGNTKRADPAPRRPLIVRRPMTMKKVNITRWWSIWP